MQQAEEHQEEPLPICISETLNDCISLRTITMETPVPGLVLVDGDVMTNVDDIIHGERRLDKD